MSNPEKPGRNPEIKDEHKGFIEEGIMRGHQAALEKGLKVGQLVYHPSDDCIYKLKSIENNIATVWIPAGTANNAEDIVKQFPYAELIDPKAAYKGSIEAKLETLDPPTTDPTKFH